MNSKIMPFLSALRMTQECCLYVMLGSVILFAMGAVMSPVVCLACIFAGGLLSFYAQWFLGGAGTDASDSSDSSLEEPSSEKQGNHANHGITGSFLSFLPALLPLGYMLKQVRTLSDIILLVPPFLLYLLYIIRRYEVQYYHLTDAFWKNMALFLLGGGMGLLLSNSWAFPMALICLVLQVFLLRILRQEKDHILTKTSLLLEIGLLIVLCLICLMVGSHAFLGALAAVWSEINRLVIIPLVQLFVIILYGFFWLLFKVTGLLDSKSDEEMPMLLQQAEDVFKQTEDAAQESNPLIWQIIQGLVVLALVIVAIRWLYLRYRSKLAAKEQEVGDNVQTYRTSVSGAKQSTDTISLLDRSPRSKIRRAYIKYLKTMGKSGYHQQPYHTSLDVHDTMPEGTGKEKAAQLRKLYLSARYDNTSEITNKMAEQAAALEKEIRNGDVSFGISSAHWSCVEMIKLSAHR